MNSRSKREGRTIHDNILRTVQSQLNSGSASVGAVYGALHCNIDKCFVR